ncbi:MAG TPA: hypothetical protein VKR60_00500 [Candidatus Sulfotelmatobacter sp.]|nr:hypothetical protein [Candidatus Sulfotelmatobacter sp.]
MPISAVDAISPALLHTKKQLFQPFRFGQWAKLAVVGLLAGELGSSGGCNNFNFNNINLPRGDSGRHFLEQSFLLQSWNMPDLALYAGLIAALVAAGLVLGVIMMYVGSVMRFILFDSVLAGECRVGEGWGRRQGPGFRYFVWKILYLLASVAFVTMLIGIPLAAAFGAGWVKEPKEHVAALILGGIFLFLVIFIFALAAAVVFVFTKDFVVPQMALEGIGAFEGWRRLWPMMKAEKGDYVIYVVMKIVLAIVAAVIIGIVTLIMTLFFAVPTAVLAVVGVLAGKSAGLTWNAYTITLAVVVGCILLFIFLYLLSLVSVPVIVFFPAYSIYFFAGRYPALSRALYPAPAAAASQLGVSPHGEPPPLPPAPAPAG